MKKSTSLMLLSLVATIGISYSYITPHVVDVSVQSVSDTHISTNQGDFVNTISPINLKFDSDVKDINRQLAYRGRYNMTINGFNLPVHGLQKNILSVTKIQTTYNQEKDDSMTMKVLKTIASIAVKQSGVDLLGDLITDIN